MNEEITQCVSRNFYEVDGEKLIASDFSKSRTLTLSTTSEDMRIRNILQNAKSIHLVNVTTETSWEDMNQEEADFIADMVNEALKSGMKVSDVAVITPYRRQVKAIRSSLNRLHLESLPLIDTVERLQGQDVDMIIVSFCVSHPIYYQQNEKFLLNPNRLNVMISRAKKKVVMITSSTIENKLKRFC